MPSPGEYKTVQSRIIAYAQEIGWAYVPREEAERRRGFDPDGATAEDRARLASLYFDDLLHAQSSLSIQNTKRPKARWSASSDGSTRILLATASFSPTYATRANSFAPKKSGTGPDIDRLR